MKKILVTGGLGFIGSHTCVSLFENGYEPIVIDNLSNSLASVQGGIETLAKKPIRVFAGDIRDTELLDRIFNTFKIEGVIHFAALKAVNESVLKPLDYFDNNINGLLNVIKAMEKHQVKHLVFSSSCTVYGNPDVVPVTEKAPYKKAESPYGLSKQMGEQILMSCPFIQTQCLRYFNPVGAHPSSVLGEQPFGVPGNLIPYLTQTVAGVRKELTVFGNDYNTKDGFCMRDFIHVCDLGEAHIAALERSLSNQAENPVEMFNIGTGKGLSVLELINSFEKATGEKVNYTIGPRRPGDIEQVWADTQKSERLLGWKAKRSTEEMMLDSWNWQKKITQ